VHYSTVVSPESAAFCGACQWNFEEDLQNIVHLMQQKFSIPMESQYLHICEEQPVNRGLQVWFFLP